MTAAARHVTMVFGVLLALTVAALCFTTSAAHDLLSSRGAAAIAGGLAFVKAWFVVRDFMELNGTVLWRAMNGWFAVVGVVCLALILR